MDKEYWITTSMGLISMLLVITGNVIGGAILFFLTGLYILYYVLKVLEVSTTDVLFIVPLAVAFGTAILLQTFTDLYLSISVGIGAFLGFIVFIILEEE
ncbi:MAG: hypothetical protein KKD18_00395 [Nanoarchaeota archaeon]|nr:hypothetical protein [Nanoarchaeota archaeon]